MAKMLEITLKKSLIGRNEKQRANVKALGLKKIGQTVLRKDIPEIRGMIKKVDFLLDVKEVEVPDETT